MIQTHGRSDALEGEDPPSRPPRRGTPPGQGAIRPGGVRRGGPGRPVLRRAALPLLALGLLLAGPAVLRGQASADVSVSKTGPTSVEEGRTFYYYVTVTNAGPDTARDVVVTDTLPSGNDARFETATGSPAQSGRVLTWPARDLAPGASATFTLEMREEAGAGSSFTNVAALTSSTADPDASNDRDELTTQVEESFDGADLHVTKTGPDSAFVGDTVTYEITVRNLGSNRADNTVASDTLPAGVSFVSATGGGSASGGVVTWPAFDLDGGTTQSFTVDVVVTAAGSQQDVAAASSDSPDPDPSNNDGSDPDARTTTVTFLEADLSVTKTDGRTLVQQGESLTYTITATNAGPDGVTGATVTDTFPPQLGSVSWSCSGSAGGSCSVGSGAGDLVGVAVDLPAGASVTFTATGTVSGTGTLSNTAHVAPPPDALDPDATDDAATDDDTKIAVYAADVTPDGLDTLARLPRDVPSYGHGFTLVNASNVDADFDLFGFRLGTSPPVVSVDSITGPGVESGARPDSARTSSLPPGDTIDVTVWFGVELVEVGRLDRLYLEARPTADATARDSGWAAVEVTGPDLVTSKSVSPSSNPPPGTDLTYTVTVTNEGSEEALGVVAVDSLPAEVDFEVGSTSSSLPSGVAVTVEFSDDDGATWSYTPVSEGCGAPTGYDGCVDRIRWSLQDPLSSSSPDNTGTLTFVARIR